MTSPPQVRHTSVSPLYPRHHLGKTETHTRDLQIWPRAMRETGNSQSLHRTAGVKHHLRGMAEREDMLTTYEHDFGMMTRDRPERGSSRASSTRSSAARISAPRDGDEQSVRSSDRGSGRNIMGHSRDPGGTLGPSTAAKLRTMSETGEPLRLTVNGWGDQRWSPKTHPSMVLGMSGKRIGLVQTVNIMNLRSPDLPFATR
mmetsp:Transcript_146541/g.255694  ORF Transcript_146541/g.255694 Transcript_146541/m.255694 type:complete len:201 (-) Transcript_146541:211-813(-)